MQLLRNLHRSILLILAASQLAVSQFDTFKQCLVLELCSDKPTYNPTFPCYQVALAEYRGGKYYKLDGSIIQKKISQRLLGSTGYCEQGSGILTPDVKLTLVL